MHKAQQAGTLPRRKNLSDAFRLSGQLFCSDWNEIPNMSASSRTVILLLLRISSFTWLMFSFVLFVYRYPEHSTTSIEDKPLAKIRKPLKTLCSCHFLSTKTTFNTVKAFIVFLLFKAKCDVGTKFFHVCHFLGMIKLQMEQQTPVLNKTSLNNHTCYCNISSRKGFSDSTLSTPSS